MEIKKNKITVVLGIDTDLNIEEENLEKDFLQGIKLNDYIKNKFNNLSEEKIKEAYKICLLNDKELDKPLNVLSSNEIEKVELMIKLLENREVIILSDFEINFLNKELNYFKSLFKKMVTKYNKTIVLITNKLDKIMDLVDIILVVENKKVILELSSSDIYSDRIYENNIDTPDIIEFVKMVRRKNIKMEDYTDVKELIKAIFRSVS